MKVVLQDGIKDCGICSLLSIIRYYGGDVSKEYLREITNTTKDGVSLYNLMEASKQVGFDSLGMEGKLEDIKTEDLPCIAHLNINKSYQHFVVLYEINRKKKTVTLMDPAKGRKTISMAEFNLLSTHNFLFLKKIKKMPIIKRKNIIRSNTKKIFKEKKLIVIVIFLLTMIYFVFNIITSLHFKYILEYSISYSISENIFSVSYILLLGYLLKNTNYLFRNILLLKWSSLFDYETTTLTYKEILLLPYLYFKNRTAGEIISRFKDLNTVRTYIINFFCIISIDLLTLVIFLTIMFTYSKELTLIILVCLLSLITYNLIIMKYKKKNIFSLSKKEDIVNSYIIQGISNVDTVKGSHLEKRLLDKFSISYKSFLDSLYKLNIHQEAYNLIKSNITDIIKFFMYSLGSIYVIRNKLTLNNLILYQTFYSYFSVSFSNITALIENYTSYKNALIRIEEIFMLNKDNFSNNYYYLPYKLDGDIIYNQLDYKIGSKVLFNNLSLRIKKGEKILLSGDSGSGKSTLLKILLRYIEVDYNKVSISGIDINHYHLENIRNNITYVASEEYLFSDTLRNNIMLYKEYKEEEFDEVCKICLIDELIKNNILQYNMLIEEDGFNFSHGEKQRIVLARSIIKNSSIYILDEALSGLDLNKEKKILTNIFQYLKDKTVIVISHRSNNKKLFDRVLKLENGKINEN